MEWEVEAAQRVVERSSKKWEGKNDQRWDETCSVTPSFICTIGDNVMIHFPRKR
jgi:hypothetical protein